MIAPIIVNEGSALIYGLIGPVSDDVPLQKFPLTSPKFFFPSLS